MMILGDGTAGRPSSPTQAPCHVAENPGSCWRSGMPCSAERMPRKCWGLLGTLGVGVVQCRCFKQRRKQGTGKQTVSRAATLAFLCLRASEAQSSLPLPVRRQLLVSDWLVGCGSPLMTGLDKLCSRDSLLPGAMTRGRLNSARSPALVAAMGWEEGTRSLTWLVSCLDEAVSPFPLMHSTNSAAPTADSARAAVSLPACSRTACRAPSRPLSNGKQQPTANSCKQLQGGNGRGAWNQEKAAANRRASNSPASPNTTTNRQFPLRRPPSTHTRPSISSSPAAPFFLFFWGTAALPPAPNKPDLTHPGYSHASRHSLRHSLRPRTTRPLPVASRQPVDKFVAWRNLENRK